LPDVVGAVVFLAGGSSPAPTRVAGPVDPESKGVKVMVILRSGGDVVPAIAEGLLLLRSLVEVRAGRPRGGC